MQLQTQAKAVILGWAGNFCELLCEITIFKFSKAHWPSG